MASEPLASLLSLRSPLASGALGAGAPRHIRDFDFEELGKRRIAVDRHCFGCTAGAGSSCGGATT